MQHWSNRYEREQYFRWCHLSPVSLKAPITLLLEAPSLPYQITEWTSLMAVIWSLVKEDYSFALTRIDTVYNLLVGAQAGNTTWLTPSSAEGKRPPYVIIKDGVQHRDRRHGAFLLGNVRKDKGYMLKSTPAAWVRVPKLGWKENSDTVSLYFSWFAACSVLHNSREFAFSNWSLGSKPDVEW